jgi:hypothetical protein
MSDRTPTTDALETLGMIHFKPEARDAIHLAVDAVKAGCNLCAGERIGIIDGVAWPINKLMGHEPPNGHLTYKVPYHGIVDPFLPTKRLGDTDMTYSVLEGESFWFVMAPRMVKSLRHVWEHPDFPEGK